MVSLQMGFGTQWCVQRCSSEHHTHGWIIGTYATKEKVTYVHPHDRMFCSHYVSEEHSDHGKCLNYVKTQDSLTCKPNLSCDKIYAKYTYM